MKEQFITYEIALKLKELGFDEECFAWFDENKEIRIAPDVYKKWTSKPLTNLNIIKVFNIDCITAPLYQQVIDWFREKHKIDIYPEPTYSLTEYSFKVITVHGKSKKQEYWDGMGKTYNTYQEAREQAILKMLNAKQGKESEGVKITISLSDQPSKFGQNVSAFVAQTKE